jgi:hypothetical protein
MHIEAYLIGTPNGFVTLYAVFRTFVEPAHRFQALYLFIAETANVVFDIGLIYEPLITRYGTEPCIVLYASSDH